MQGDIRLAPFYDMAFVKECVEAYVAQINQDPTLLQAPALHGPHSKYALPAEADGSSPGSAGRVELRWVVEGENGVACSLLSKGFRALKEATEAVLGFSRPYSIGGSLPLIRDLQDRGFDVQISGYGSSAKYHANDESADLDHLKGASRIIAKVT